MLPVLAQAGARRNGIAGVRQGRLIVAVTPAPEKGKANEAILDLLAEALGVKRRQITLRSGQTQSRKQFVIAGADRDVLAARLETVLA
jgi:uncharacterized protein (TIGR00251 family)